MSQSESLPRIILRGFLSTNISKHNYDQSELQELYEWLSKIPELKDREKVASILISNDDCLTSCDRRTRLLLASCLIQVLRLSVPNQPFSIKNLEIVLLFILGQLALGLQCLDVEERELALKLLQCVTSIRLFRLCYLLKNGQQLLTSVLTLMLPIAEHAVVMERSLLLQLIKSILNDPNIMTDPKVLLPLAEAILIGPQTNLARVLTKNGSEKYFGEMMSKLLICLLERQDSIEDSKDEMQIPKSLQGLGIYSFAIELYNMNPKLVQPAYPLFELRLKSLNTEERIECLKVVLHILLQEKATKDHPLFQYFIDRFTDVNLAMRIRCVHGAAHLLQLQPTLFANLKDILQQRSFDPDSAVRCEVACVCTQIMLKNLDTLDLLPVLCCIAEDKESQLQVEAVKGMACIYKKHLMRHLELNEAQKKASYLIFKTILAHFFSVSAMVAKLVTERLLYSFILPASLSLEARIERLLYFISGTDGESIEALLGIYNEQRQRRIAVLKWILLPAKMQKQAAYQIGKLNMIAPDAKDRQWIFLALSTCFEMNRHIRQLMISLLQEELTETEMDNIVTQVTDYVKKVYPSASMEIYKLRQALCFLYKGLINKEALSIIIQKLNEMITNSAATSICEPNTYAIKSSLKKIAMTFSEPLHESLHTLEMLQPLLHIPSGANSEAAAIFFSFLSAIGKDKPLETQNPQLVEQLLVICKESLFSSQFETLSLNFIKETLNFIATNIPSRSQEILISIFQLTKTKLDELPPSSRTPYIYMLGQLSAVLPESQRSALKSTISRKVVKEVIMQSCTSEEMTQPSKFWLDSELSVLVFCKVQSLRTMARWILNTQKEDMTTISNTLRMMDAFLMHKGDLLDEGTLREEEKCALRLEAGACILKICRIPNSITQLTASQIHNLSQLVMDEDPSVRAQFAAKVNKGLINPDKNCLPTMFVSMLALGALDPNPEIQLSAVNYIENLFYCKSSFPVWPEYCMYWTIPLLASAPCSWVLPVYKSGNVVGWPVINVLALHQVRLALWSNLLPMILRQMCQSVGRLQTIIQNVKNCQDALPTDNFSNQRLWITCDLATSLLETYKSSLSYFKPKHITDTPTDTEPQEYKLVVAHISNPNFFNKTKYVNYGFGVVPVLPSKLNETKPQEVTITEVDEEQETQNVDMQ